MLIPRANHLLLLLSLLLPVAVRAQTTSRAGARITIPPAVYLSQEEFQATLAPNAAEAIIGEGLRFGSNAPHALLISGTPSDSSVRIEWRLPGGNWHPLPTAPREVMHLPRGAHVLTDGLAVRATGPAEGPPVVATLRISVQLTAGH